MSNIVEDIKSQLSGPVLNKLSAQIGASETTTRAAINGLVPALLRAISTGPGLQRLMPALERFSGVTPGNVNDDLARDPESVAADGGDMANSILGDGTVSRISGAVARFTGLGAGAVEKLVAYIMPAILGTISSRFAGKAINSQTIAKFFSDQKANISSAMPAGLQLEDIPGATEPRETFHRVGSEARAQNPDWAKWLVPVGLAALALVVYLAWPKEDATRPARLASAPEVAEERAENIDDTLDSLTDELQGITDRASAEDALPRLREIDLELAQYGTTVDRMSETGQSIGRVVADEQSAINDAADRVMALPGVPEVIGPVMDGIMNKLNTMAQPAN